MSSGVPSSGARGARWRPPFGPAPAATPGGRGVTRAPAVPARGGRSKRAVGMGLIDSQLRKSRFVSIRTKNSNFFLNRAALAPVRGGCAAAHRVWPRQNISVCHLRELQRSVPAASPLRCVASLRPSCWHLPPNTNHTACLNRRLSHFVRVSPRANSATLHAFSDGPVVFTTCT